jgi:pseudouridine kinase
MTRTVCLGGATVDRTYSLAGPLLPETSNPATARTGFGGVARNVAAGLARAGVPVELVSRIGADEAGRALLAALDSAGIGRGAVRVAPGHATAEYVAVLTPAGELALGLAAMDVFDAITPEALAAEAGLLAAASWIFADCNLPAETLAALTGRRFGGVYRLALDAVSVAKSARLPDRLDGVDLLFLNRDEAAALAPRFGQAPGEPAAIAAALVGAGARGVVLTLGAGGALAATRAGVVTVPAVPARVVDVTGAGDALVAATLAARMAGADLPAAVAQGCAAAAATVGRVRPERTGVVPTGDCRFFTKP